MPSPTNDFVKLCQAITAYCKKMREGSDSLQNAAHKFKKLFKEILPPLAKTFNDDDADTVYAQKLIHFVVNGLGNEHLTKLWDLYFVLNSTAYDVAQQANYSRSSIIRHAEAFPRMVAEHLFSKNSELIAQPYKIELSESQKQKEILQRSFKLTPRQAEVLLLYAYTLYTAPHRSRKDIASALYITDNTLKAHIRKITGKVGVEKMNEAAEKAADVLRKHPDSGWRL
jgi:DNA-binding CsgD family transcriptional regulator